MIYSKGEAIRRSILFTVMIFILGAIMTTAIVFIVFSCADRKVPYSYPSSYDEVKAEFRRDKNMILPDLSPLGLYSSQQSYMVWYDSRYHMKPLSYYVDGNASISGKTVRISSSGHAPDDMLYTQSPQSLPVEYNGELINRSYFRFDDSKSFEDACYIIVNGYEYRIKASFYDNEGLSDDEFNAFREEVQQTLLDYMKGVVDGLKAE